MPIPVGQLVKHQKELITVLADTALHDALALMIEHKFSQLPVVDQDYKPTAIVTTDGIISALLTFSTTPEKLRVKDASTPPFIFRADGDLLFLLDSLLSATAAFVTDSDGKLVGIITSYDTTQYFRQRAEDIVLVEDIERMLKNLLLETFGATAGENDDLRAGIAKLSTPLDETREKGVKAIKSYCAKNKHEVVQEDAEKIIDKAFPVKERPFNSLTLYDYVLFAQQVWTELDPVLAINKDAWFNMMDAIREIRNKLVHFRGEVSTGERVKLRRCAQWFQTHQRPQKDATTISEDQANEIKTPSSPQGTSAEDGSILLSSYKLIGDVMNRVAATDTPPKNSFNLSLETIEHIIGAALPKTAYEHITWWTEDLAKTKQWEDEGWRVRSLRVTPKPYIVFQRIQITPREPLKE